MKPYTDIGSLRVLPKDPHHITGDGNDGTTTILHKAIAMAHGLNLRQHNEARRSVRRHRCVKAIVYWTIVISLSAWAASVMVRYYGG